MRTPNCLRAGGVEYRRSGHYRSDFEFLWRTQQQGIPRPVTEDANLLLNQKTAGSELPPSLSSLEFSHAVLDEFYDESVGWKVSFDAASLSGSAGTCAATRFVTETVGPRVERRARGPL